MSYVESMLVLTEAISKGAKPYLTKEGQEIIAAYINGKVYPAEQVQVSKQGA